MLYVAIVSALVLVLALLYVYVCIRPQIADKAAWKKTDFMCPYAHRGLYGGEVAENSMTAFRRAVEAGYGIELDIQLSADGEVMVIHDYALSRMTGQEGMVQEKTREQLQHLRLHGTADTIPTLREVLALVDGRVPLLIELKGESADVSLCPAADAILSEYSGPYLVESFNPFQLRWYRKNRPSVLRGLLVTNLCRTDKWTPLGFALIAMLPNILARPNFLSYDLRFCRTASIWLCTRLFPIPRFGWTVKTPEAWEIAMRENAAPIFEGAIPDTYLHFCEKKN